jgi:hypothetical protein
MEEEKGDKGFKVTDRRMFTTDGEKEETPVTDESQLKEEKAAPLEGEKGAEEAEKIEEVPLPEINFSTFVVSLSHSIMLHLGELADPVTKKVEKNLPLAKQTIDILGMLKEKTEGNLTEEEQALMQNMLTDLRMRYVKEVSK